MRGGRTVSGISDALLGLVDAALGGVGLHLLLGPVGERLAQVVGHVEAFFFGSVFE
jgi:hypothetical protein